MQLNIFINGDISRTPPRGNTNHELKRTKDKMRFSELVKRLDRARTRQSLIENHTGIPDSNVPSELKSLRQILAKHLPVSVNEAAIMATELCLELDEQSSDSRIATELARSLELGQVKLAQRATAKKFVN